MDNIAEKLKEADKYISGCFDEDNFPSSHGKTQLKSFLLSALTSVREEAIREVLKELPQKNNRKKDYNSGWTGLESGECCEMCAMASSKNPLQALVGCTNPFQLKESFGLTLCQCHIPHRKGFAGGFNACLEHIKGMLTKKL